MPGASSETRRLNNVNANWHPAALTAIVTMARADTVLAWDPTNATLIAANIVGQMPWTSDLTDR
jgi:hypothetical protein